MKVAVSIPDPVFSEAEQLARELGLTRSALYTRALTAFVGVHSPDRITERMNAVVDAVGNTPDEFTQEAARRVLACVEW